LENENLWSRRGLFGYSRKVLVLVVIVLANVIDQSLSLNRAVTCATVLFYIANKGLSITVLKGEVLNGLYVTRERLATVLTRNEK